METVFTLLVTYWYTALAVLLGLIVLYQSLAIAGGDQFITLERRWFGSTMTDGRTVALKDEVGVQARTLGPGAHVLIPFIYKVTKHNFISLGTDRQIAEQERITFSTQRQAQEERKLLESAKAQANMQPQVVESERGVEISKNLAKGEIEKSTGEARAIEIRAEGKAKATRLQAGADAEATTVTATADAEAIEKKGLASALVILEQGKSTAESYKLQVNAMGNDVFGQIQVVEKIASNKLKLIPDVYVGGGGAGEQSGLMSLALLQYLLGKNVLPQRGAGAPPGGPAE